PEAGQRAEEVGPTARRVLHAVAELVALGAAAAADRVVTATGVLHDREQPAAQVRIDAVPPGEKDGLGVLHRVRRVVALVGIRGVVAEEAHGLAALEVDDPEHLTPLQHARPILPGRDHAVLDQVAPDSHRFGATHAAFNAP